MNEITILLNGFEPFYILFSPKTAQPFLYEGEVFIFTDTVAMDKKLEYFRLLGYEVEAVPVGRSRDVLPEDIYVSGAATVVLDDQDFIGDRVVRCPIEDLTEVYPDNATSESVPLVNRELSRALNECFQEHDELSGEEEERIAQLLHAAQFLAPIDHGAYAVTGAPVFPTLNGGNTIPVFTDYRAFMTFIGTNADPNKTYDPWLLSYEDMRKCVEENPEVGFVLNAQGINYLIPVK